MRCTLLIAISVFLFLVHSRNRLAAVQAPPSDSPLVSRHSRNLELGEIIRQQLESEFLVLDEDPVTATSETVGERVARHLPETGLTYEFLLFTNRPESSGIQHAKEAGCTFRERWWPSFERRRIGRSPRA